MTYRSWSSPYDHHIMYKYDVICLCNNKDDEVYTQIYVLTHSSRYAFVFKRLYIGTIAVAADRRGRMRRGWLTI